jgi:hypothetical protein
MGAVIAPFVAALVAVPDLDLREALAARVAGRGQMLARAFGVEDGLRGDLRGVAGIGRRQDRARRDGEVLSTVSVSPGGPRRSRGLAYVGLSKGRGFEVKGDVGGGEDRVRAQRFGEALLDEGDLARVEVGEVHLARHEGGQAPPRARRARGRSPPARPGTARARVGGVAHEHHGVVGLLPALDHEGARRDQRLDVGGVVVAVLVHHVLRAPGTRGSPPTAGRAWAWPSSPRW